MTKTEYGPETRRAQRVLGYLNDLLSDSLPQYSENYEVCHKEVEKHVVKEVSPNPVRVGFRDRPTYEFYIKPKSHEKPKEKVMILHGPDLRAMIPGGIKNERSYFRIDSFKDNLEKAIERIETESKSSQKS